MTSFFSDLEDQLRAAARERTTGDTAPGPPPPDLPPRRRWLAGGARLVPVALAVAVTLAVVVGALVLLGHRAGHSPVAPAAAPPQGTALSRIVATTPGPQLRRESALIGAATKKVLALPACRVAQPGPAKLIHRAPGQALLSTLGVLRRPATPADRLPAAEVTVGGLDMAVYAGGARRALTVGHTAYFVVPIREMTVGAIPSDRCLTLQAQALRRALPTMPAVLRPPTRALQAAFIAQDRRLAAAPPQDGICRVSVSGDISSAECGEPLQAIQHGTIPIDDDGTYSGVVPDGVASVTLRFPATAARAARSVTTTVHDNVFVVPAPADVSFKLSAEPTVIWSAADGSVLKTFPPPGPQSVKPACGPYPQACLPMVLGESATTSPTGTLNRATAAHVAGSRSAKGR